MKLISIEKKIPSSGLELALLFHYCIVTEMKRDENNKNMILLPPPLSLAFPPVTEGENY